jgi:CSLREA domain-containing protein
MVSGLAAESTRRWPRSLIVVGLAALALQAGPAHAAPITVKTTVDELTTNGKCSLREAIRNANDDAATHPDCASGSGADTITLKSRRVYQLALAGEDDAAASGDLDIVAGSTVSLAPKKKGAATVDGGGIDRVFEVVTGGTLSLTRITVRNGHTAQDGGGITSGGSLTLTNSTVHGNSTDDDGGDINSGGTLGIRNSTIRDNSAGGGGGGIRNSGPASLTGSTVSGNTSGENGGGIRSLVASLTVINSTISGNTAGSEGGGLTAGGAVTLASSTVSGNTAPADAGGGIHGEATLRNTIVANNTGGDCAGTLSSQGYNLFEATAGCIILGPGTDDVTGQDPQLGPLTKNGGPTLTHMPAAAGPAVDAGNPVPPDSGDGSCPAADQRGRSRPRDGDADGSAICDIGAVERRRAKGKG